MKIGIGIDTGGTYTDAVVYDFDSHNILGSAKALTTNEDLSIGILGALDGLPADLIKQTELISLSTTLATNACVEDKGGNAKLIIFGGDEQIIEELGGEFGLPDVSEIHIQESYTRFSGEIEREVDWSLFLDRIEQDIERYDGVGIIEMNAMKNGAVVEKKAKNLLRERYNMPVVCGHELFSELSCLRRSASALLNARLIPVIKSFLDAIKTAMRRRGIEATVVIVRSDGGLMSEEFAASRPVETLLCGPAASVAGGIALSGEANSVIVDMGGTTVDIALVKDHIPVSVVDGVNIGKWKTFVNGLYVKTFGLGGDTAIHYQDQTMYLEPYRVIPLCVAADKYPVILETLQELASTRKTHTKFLCEHYILIKDISEMSRYTEEERKFCAALKQGPLSLRNAPLSVGKDMYTLNVSRLLKEGVVQLCGLTPTDIMHIRGDFTRYSREASLLGAQYVANNLGVSVDALCEMVYDEIKRKIYRNIVKLLLENKSRHYLKNSVHPEVERFIDESYEMAKTGKIDPLISATFKTNYKIVGIGAPIKLFLGDVAMMLGTEAILSPHFEVANALGAIIGHVSATHTVKIKPDYNTSGISGYIVFGNDRNEAFETLEEAQTFAIEEAKRTAEQEVIKRGARGEIAVTCNLDHEEAQARDCSIYLGTSVIARAVGALGK